MSTHTILSLYIIDDLKLNKNNSFFDQLFNSFEVSCWIHLLLFLAATSIYKKKN